MGTIHFDFNGEVALITGGSRGLGLEAAQAFGQAGASVVITARRQSWLDEAEKTLRDQGISVLALVCDVTDPTNVEQAVEQALATYGKIDILLNNAGQVWVESTATMPLERWQQVITTNLTGTFLVSQVVGRHMLERQKGTMINTASIAGLGGGEVHFIGYSASKAAIINFTRALAVEWAPSHIRVNCVAPGFFRTRLTQGLLDQGVEAQVSTTTPLGRIGQPGEFAPTVLFLASDGASYITGQVIPIDGGETAK